MAPDIVAEQPGAPNARVEALLKARDSAIYHAAAESSAIAAMLLKQDVNSSEFDFMLRGLLIRLEALGASSCVLQTSDASEAEQIADEYQIVFGEKLEVAHA